MCILLYGKYVCIPYIYAIGRAVHLPYIYVHSAICYLFGVVVFHRSMVNWRRYMALVYVHSAICETYLV